MPIRVREEVPQGTRPRYVVTQLTTTETTGIGDMKNTLIRRTFYVIDLQDKARAIWKVGPVYPYSSSGIRARQKAETIARQMNSSYERSLRGASVNG